jgi:hypothetical protein
MTDITPADDAPLTFAAYAVRIGKSRPYVSQLKAKGILHGPAFSPDGKLIPSIADAQRAAAADPARGPNGAPATTDFPRAESGYAAERTRKLRLDAQLTELELARQRGRYIDRAVAGPAIAGFFRSIRDDIVLAIREHPDRAEDAIIDVFARKAAELPNVFPAEGAPATS